MFDDHIQFYRSLEMIERNRKRRMEIKRTGVTRVVILTKHYAFKIPNFCESWGDKWRLFLHGLLANMQERRLWQVGRYPELCPVIFYIPLGFLVVMPRVPELTDDEFYALDFETLVNRPDYYVPAEPKPNSWGWLNGYPVAIDYGN